jgi:hypothetical protein
MHVERHVVTIATSTGGAGTDYTPDVTGRLLQIRYVKTDYANGVDFAVTDEETGESLWAGTDVNASVTVAPRQVTHTSTGGGINYAATFPVYDYHHLANTRVKIAVTDGGVTKTGTFHVEIG